MIKRLILKLKSIQIYIRFKKLGLKQVPPNYVFFDRFELKDVAIDVGIGNDPDFSKYLISNYGIECFGVDPTHKHEATLKQLERDIHNFHYLPYALGPENSKVQFFESLVNVSGSLLQGHRNIINDPVVSYNVNMVTLEELLRIVGKQKIAIMKIDIEGSEYQVINNIDQESLHRIQQLIVEFHHDTVKEYSWQDTDKAIKRLESLGMKSFVYNGRDCLFYW